MACQRCSPIEEDEGDETKLSHLFAAALDLFEKLTKCEGVSSDPQYQIEIKKCINLLERSTELINISGLFSSNETLEDVSSQNLRYFLIPGFLGILILKVQSMDRINTLETAEIYLKDFIKRVQEYEIISPHTFDFDNEAEGNTEEIKPKLLNLQQLAIQRNEKIKKYKEKKEAESELHRLKSLLIKDDDETVRNYFLAYIKYFVNVAIEELHLIKQEKPLAKHLSENRSKENSFKKNLQEKSYPAGIFKPIIITRNELQKKVFGAGYPSLPTMTVEEFYRERVSEGIFPAEGSRQGTVLQEIADSEKVKIKEEAEEIINENKIESDNPKHLSKAREFDDYKDSHRRGWGNRMNRS